MFGIGAAIKAIVTLIIVAIIAGGLWYLSNLQANLAIATQNNEILEKSLTSQSEVIDSIRGEIAQIQETNAQIQEQNQKQLEDVKKLTSKFSTNSKGEPSDFGAAAAQNPEKFEYLVNRGSTNAVRCLELASGAPLNETEKLASTPQEANRECPSLINTTRNSSR